ncbi:MAG: bis(5'-nucleosyl)-tetraphosphatase [Gammaproteobacteria bacterium]
MTPRTLSSGIVIVRRKEDGWRYLLLRAYQHWDFPKGLVEAGETPLEAACREVREETTLEQLQFHWGRIYVETGPYWKNKVARYYLAEAPEGEVTLPVNPELGRPEHEEFKWVSRGEAELLVRPRVARVLAWADARINSVATEDR